ncbi:MAG: hypothetical protein KC478_02715 [Bacteriovoracaceae bacterium]|nr:hypothetical protein [Bacteriovoracaceae bacterium]
MKTIFILFTLILPASSWALTPLKGIIKGDVVETIQYDPLDTVFSRNFTDAEVAAKQSYKLKMYTGMYDQAANLVNSCDVERFYNYPAKWREDSAKRSVVATLQYLGLDYSVRAIAKYARTLKLEDDSFKNLVDNLIVNNCSENISVFSKKLLRNNLENFYEDGLDFQTPTLKDSPFFSPELVNKSEGLDAKRREFNFAIKNFRAFCSWDGDVDNYALLAPYLQNPIIMSHVFNHLERKELVWDEESEDHALVENKDSVMVACEDLVCRRRNYPAFTRLFPRMVGAAEIRDDLKVLYCNHFRDTSIKSQGASETIKEWMKKQTLEETRLEAMYFVSLLTGISDPFFSAETFVDLRIMYSQTFEDRWDEWSKNKTEQLVLDLLYEESLFVDLSPADEYQKAAGELGLVFDFTLGELDRELKIVDKISASFHLEFPKSYFRWIRNAYIRAGNVSNYKKLEDLEKKFATYIDIQLENKKQLFKIPVWNEKFSSILAKQLIEQLVSYKGQGFKGLSHRKIKVPIKFRFGLFALKYLREKYKAKYSSKP